jgi:hypothetical protein
MNSSCDGRLKSDTKVGPLHMPPLLQHCLRHGATLVDEPYPALADAYWANSGALIKCDKASSSERHGPSSQ